MTPQERARQIDKEEFEAECLAARARALAHFESAKQRDRQQIDGWLGRIAPVMPFKGAPIHSKRTRKASNPKPARLHTHAGQQRTLAEWSEVTGISVHTLSSRLSNGWTIDRALTTPVAKTGRAQPRALHEVNGEALTLEGWAQRLGTSYNSLCNRIARYGSLAAVVTAKPKRRAKVEVGGLAMGVRAWATYLGIPPSTLYHRCKAAGSYEAAIHALLVTPPGVVADFDAFEGTDAGSNAFESVQIDFSEKAIME